jgi:uncharacterized damage-inducible protein DinB
MAVTSISGTLLADAFQRVHDVVHRTVEGLDEDTLVARIDPQANTIAWLTWHIARIQDDHVAGVAGQDQAWTGAGWARRFDLPFDDGAIGYGQSSEEVGQVRAPSDLLLGYLDDVHERTIAFVTTVDEDELARVVDEAWDPPVTMAVRLVSVIGDNLQHAGQAAFIRGVLERRS